MKKSMIRKITLNLAIFQLFSLPIVSKAKSENTDLSQKSSIVENYDENNNDKYILVSDNTYLRKDDVTGEYKIISIFDDENVESRQYGANQRVFRFHPDELIKDPYIWDELQSRFPITMFEDEEEALFVYKNILDIVYSNGCGYATGANFAFRLFEGHENEFYQKMGYPMYTIRDNKIDFNYEVFMLKFFFYSIIDMKEDNKGYELINGWFTRTLNEFRLFKYLRNNPLPNYSNLTDISDEEYAKFKQQEEEQIAKLRELREQMNNSKDIKEWLGVPVDARFGYIYNYLAKFGVIIDSSITSGLGKPHKDNIVASSNFTLHELDEDNNICRSIPCGDHYIYITEVKNNGRIIVSSWGKKYILDNKSATWTDCITLKLSK